MSERRIDLTESQLRKLLETAYKEAWHDGENHDRHAHCGHLPVAWKHDWKHSNTAEYLEKLIKLEDLP